MTDEEAHGWLFTYRVFPGNLPIYYAGREVKRETIMREVARLLREQRPPQHKEPEHGR
jgi:hypothetical protein